MDLKEQNSDRNSNDESLTRDNQDDFPPDDMQATKYKESEIVLFYKNEVPAKPNNEHIEEILKEWIGDYEKLERNPNYILWLFPNREQGMNLYCPNLTDEDAKIICSTPILSKRVKRAFEMMLDFYGMRITDNDQFELTENSEERLRHLNRWGNQNFLQITRILLALKEFGHKNLMLPWMKFLANLIYKEKKLNEAKNSFERYWIDTLDAEDKARLHEYRNTEIHKPAITLKDDISETEKDDITGTENTSKDDIGIPKDDKSETAKDINILKDDIPKTAEDKAPLNEYGNTEIKKPARMTPRNNDPSNPLGLCSREDISDNNADIPKDNTLVDSENIITENIPERPKEYNPDTLKETFSETAKDNNLDTSKDKILDVPKDDICETAKESDIVLFYKNEVSAKPNYECIEEILEEWIGDYKKLERNHHYIQWLFPNRVPGMNPYCPVFTDADAEIICSTPILRKRVKRAFVMMLDFYGMRITDNDQFELTENSEERLRHLNRWGNHNFLRITRILLALKEFGHKNLMLPWMMFLANLIYKEKKLNAAKDSFEMYWIDTLDAEDKERLSEYMNTEIHKPAITLKDDISETVKDANIPIRDMDTNTENNERLSYFKRFYRWFQSKLKREPSTHTVNQWRLSSGEDISDTSENNIPDKTPKDNTLVGTKDDIPKENISDSLKEYILDSPKDTNSETLKNNILDISDDNILGTQKYDISETAKEKILDTLNDNVLDMIKHNIIGTQKDDISETAKDNILDASNDNILDFRKDNILDTSKDAISETAKDNILDASNDNILDFPQDNILDTSKDTISETAKDNILDASNDNILDFPIDNILDTSKDTISETAKDNTLDIPIESETTAVSDGGTNANY